MEEKKLISVIVPCYNEQEVLPMFYKEITKVSASMQETFPELTFEYLFIDDGSKDRTLRTLRIMAKYDKRVRYISFSRNFGKEAGIYAGLSNAKGDYCVVMDADLQHPPKFLPEMYKAVSSGKYDCATTRRVSRAGESKVRSWFAKLFYKIMNRISQTEIVDGAQDFRFMSRQMVDAVLSMSEYNRFSKGIFSWVGFRVKYLEYENVERAAGSSAWSFWGLFRYSLEGIIGFSTAPLTATAIIGFISCLIGLILLIFTICKRLIIGGDPLGYPTTTCCVVFFGGLQVFCTGILGLYLGKTYLEVKHRPIYLVRETEETAVDSPEQEDTDAENADEAADEAEAVSAEKSRTAEKLEQAQRIKKETDDEFNAIVDAAFAEAEPGDEDESEDDEDEYEDDEDESEDDEDEYEDDEDESEDDEDEYEDDEDEYEDDEDESEDDEDEYEDDEDESEDDKSADAVTDAAEAPAKPKKEKFDVKIDYDSIDFDEDFDDAAEKPAKPVKRSSVSAEKDTFDEEPEEFSDAPSFAERAGDFFASLKDKIIDLKDSLISKLQHDPLEDEEFAALTEESEDDFDDLDDEFDESDEIDELDEIEETEAAKTAPKKKSTGYTAKHAEEDDPDELGDEDDFDDEEDDSTYKGAHF